MINNLTYPQLLGVLRSVFGPRPDDLDLAILLDLPGRDASDNPEWMDRRRIALEWFVMLKDHIGDLPFRAIHLCSYVNVGSNNADLPPYLDVVDSGSVRGDELPGGPISLENLLTVSSVVLAPTQFSATAPLKILARTHPFRGATLPNFLRSMIPALGLNYEAVDARVQQIKSRMDRAEAAEVHLTADGAMLSLLLDLRFRKGHASGGLMRSPGIVGNLPSGEAYIVPYEGDRDGEPSRTRGVLPVEIDGEIVLFRVEGNRALDVISKGPRATEQREKLTAEPSYGNIAELGLGVLGEWDISAVGSTLLDEKLGLHIAFGRSDHFGGAIGPRSFRDPRNVVHTDWVYVHSLQPHISVHAVVFRYPDGGDETIMKQGKIVV